ncbi:MAG: hypothetical protein M1817_002456 [Caeruleum heppii]|nr:MAG: hypothetical protein M1817_002456 [Caeruleum heppii]
MPSNHAARSSASNPSNHEELARAVRHTAPAPPVPKKKLSRKDHSISPTVRVYTKRVGLIIDNNPEQYDYIFLRDACPCSSCVDPSTKQKLFQTSDIPSNVTAAYVGVSERGSLEIQWSNDIEGYPESHTTELDGDFFRRYSSLRSRVRSRYNDQRQTLWDSAMMESDVLWVDYKAYMTSEDAFFHSLQHLSNYGLIFLNNVPNEENAVEWIGGRIGQLRDTFYGRTWDVRSVPSAKNVAYTNQYLGPHMDLLYFANPPTLQLLHCIKNSAIGGSSLFSDAFRAATHLRLSSPMLFNALSTFPVTYHYVNDNQHYHFTRPTLELEPHSYTDRPRLANVNYSPPFQAPFEINIGSDDLGAQLRQYLAAIKTFAAQVESPESLYETRLEPGQCVIFNNRRVLHARTAFELNSGRGERWLKGAYVDGDPFWSKLRVSGEQERVRRLQQREGGEMSRRVSGRAEPNGHDYR